MKRHFLSTVGKVTKVAQVHLSELYGDIKDFNAEIGSSECAMVKRTAFFLSQCLEDFYCWLQSTTYGVVGPGIEENLDSNRTTIECKRYYHRLISRRSINRLRLSRHPHAKRPYLQRGVLHRIDIFSKDGNHIRCCSIVDT